MLILRLRVSKAFHSGDASPYNREPLVNANSKPFVLSRKSYPTNGGVKIAFAE